MIEHFVISGDGCLGKAVTVEAEARGLDFVATSRRLTGARNGTYYLDLLRPWVHVETGPRELPEARTVYLIASTPNFKSCRLVQDSWVTNVDSQILLAKHYAGLGAFVVFISSDSVEWSTEALATQKRQVEACIVNVNGGIVRPDKLNDRVKDAPALAKVILDVGTSRKFGIYRWRSS